MPTPLNAGNSIFTQSNSFPALDAAEIPMMPLALVDMHLGNDLVDFGPSKGPYGRRVDISC